MRYEMRYLKEIDLSAAASAVVKYFALLDFPFSKKRGTGSYWVRGPSVYGLTTKHIFSTSFWATLSSSSLFYFRFPPIAQLTLLLTIRTEYCTGSLENTIEYNYQHTRGFSKGSSSIDFQLMGKGRLL